ncbi:SWIM zinc finger family protein [uncultured Shewanella sp.]|uniref:SWIM zinc finger family protein n=1 Tax=uncultured Shewanella sp. TaxID=173975 RepID=UPI0026237D9E|nr:SWIM zinc finger family protein [uncultured Shewanella sp.]
MQTQKTWWGRAFIDSLEEFIDSGRLERGRAYRSDSRMLKFDINDNKITATIRGNINPYFGVTIEPRYKVSLTFKIIQIKEWVDIISALCRNPGWLSKLMLNEMPSNIEGAFEHSHFLPKTYHDIKASCDCPDYANPCKHIAGVYYKIADILDTNPMLLFQFRGLTPAELHDALKKTELGKVFSEHISAPEKMEVDHQPHLYHPITIKHDSTQLTQTQAIMAERYWTMKEWELPTIDAEVVDIGAALIKKQGDYPEFWTRSNSFIGAMEEIYSNIKRKNLKALK